MPDPKHTINPDTGRPIGEDRISPFDRRFVPEENTDGVPEDETGGPEPEVGRVDVARPAKDGVFAIVNIGGKGYDRDKTRKAMKEALFGPD